MRTLKLSNMEKFIDGFKGTGDMLFASFDIYDYSHSVSVDVMKDIAKYAKKSLNISKPILKPILSTWIESITQLTCFGRK